MKITSYCAADVEAFRRVVARRTGLQFEDAKLSFLEDVLRRRLETNGADCKAYLSSLEEGRSARELSALAPLLTVGETYFFRHMDQFRALTEVALPDRWKARAPGRLSASERAVRILSAGCASGEEAYSIAILAREALAEYEVDIRGVDINPAALEKARSARFSNWALRETPPETQRKWFQVEDHGAVLNESIRNGVTFVERNLVNDDADLWPSGFYDVIFCRNVIMYFTPENAHALVARINRALAPGGYLFLGHAETLRGLSQDFHLRHTHGTFYYQRKEQDGEAPLRDAATGAVPPASSIPPLAAVFEDSQTWVDTIQKATERIQALTVPPPESRRAADRGSWDLKLAVELLKQERFSEALKIIQGLPPKSATDPDVLLLRAVLLAHGGELSLAEEVCHRLLGVDELNAGAHYVLALCREGARDRAKAAEHDRVAVYLDPAFAMPHLHLGLLARRDGDREAAQRELSQAITLLQREDASRLLLFGGGFSREALLALCRTELQACGGQP